MMRVAQLRVLGGAMATGAHRRDGIRASRAADHGQRRGAVPGCRRTRPRTRRGRPGLPRRSAHGDLAGLRQLPGPRGRGSRARRIPGATWDRLTPSSAATTRTTCSGSTRTSRLQPDGDPDRVLADGQPLVRDAVPVGSPHDGHRCGPRPECPGPVANMADAMETFESSDGTVIAYERSGDGPSVVLVGGALSDRSSARDLARLLAPTCTVYCYDRRGRGSSGDSPPYVVDLEVEDLEALIIHVAGTACRVRRRDRRLTRVAGGDRGGRAGPDRRVRAALHRRRQPCPSVGRPAGAGPGHDRGRPGRGRRRAVPGRGGRRLAEHGGADAGGSRVGDHGSTGAHHRP